MRRGSRSLAAQARSAGLVVQKPKQLQAADWSLRPLCEEQLIYAATDALVLLELPRAKGAGGRQGRGAHAQPQPARSRQATVEYTGIFLTAESRQKLLRRVPPRFAQVVADHMTLAWKPSSARGLAVGSSVKLRVSGSGQDDRIQAVSVETAERQPRSGHVTISRRPEAEAVEANDLAFTPLGEPFALDGVLGASVLLGGHDREQLPERLLARLQALADCGQPGASERFEGLEESQRYALHLAANELGFEHRSEGKKGTAQRKLIVTVPKRWKRPQGGVEGERLVIKDPKKFAALFGDVPSVRLHGRVTRSGVAWEPGAEVPAALAAALAAGDGPPRRPAREEGRGGDGGQVGRLVVVLRGFPGSGKSSLASLLRRRASADVASADDFFTDAAGLQEAHERCRQCFMELIAAGRPVIVVDNTNVRRADYAFYQSKAEAAGCSVAVLELICHSTAELERLRRRSAHGVPGGAVGAMWARWEHDPAALRLEPYLPQELLPWLREQSLLDRPAHTHLVMPRGPFVSVPAALRAEFHQRFSAEWGLHHVSEIGRSQAFRLFFDVDGLDLGRLLPALPALRALAGGALIITGSAEPPAPGYHIFVPSRIVDSGEAAALRQLWLQALPELEPFVDGQLYRNPQLRLLGGRKISKEGVDMGRVHEVVGRFDAAWEPGGSSWEWSEVSIHP
uniref:3'-5' exonuclease domain-containing protein n=1 Tax=Alexandrium monilatum TaxID=311494 RepID=A0A7S4QL71_9DINO